jgi:hypothetical protein
MGVSGKIWETMGKCGDFANKNGYHGDMKVNKPIKTVG